MLPNHHRVSWLATRLQPASPAWLRQCQSQQIGKGARVRSGRRRLYVTPLAFVAAVAASASPCWADGADCGQAPSVVGCLYDDLVEYQLPAFDQSAPELAFIRETQVFVRSQSLQLDAGSPYALLRRGDDLYHEITEPWPAPETSVRFEGERTSELTAFLAGKSDVAVTIAAPSIVVDEPIVLQGDGITLDAAGATFKTDEYAGNYVVLVEQRGRIRICNLELHSVQNNGILISDAHNVVVADSRFVDVSGNPIVVVGSTDHFDLQSNQFLRSGRAAIHVECGPEKGVIRDNQITEGTSNSNFHAGILLSDRGGHDLHAPEQIAADGTKITDRNRPPRDIIICGNTIEANLSSGIYSDGSCRNLILQNRILGNSKEGICLDNGSTANVVADNLVEGNGQRYGATDEELELDFVLRYGRMDDGTPKAKVPGISIDNAIFNIVLKNTIQDNFGGGVKMVRTAFYNTIAMNVIDSNNAGQSDRFHFVGVELGAAISDAPIEELDFTASCGNIVAGNQIVGSHYTGILLAAGSIFNNVFDNAIHDQTQLSIASVVPQQNTISNNVPQPSFAEMLALVPIPCGAGTAGASFMAMLCLLSASIMRSRPPVE
jgi:parallel beta-helix repeat protein